MTSWCEKRLPKVKTCRSRVALAVLVEPRLRGLLRYLGRGRVGDELHAQPHTIAHDGVVAIETEGEPFAIQHLVAHIIVDEGLQLLLGRNPLPRARELRR